MGAAVSVDTFGCQSIIAVGISGHAAAGKNSGAVYRFPYFTIAATRQSAHQQDSDELGQGIAVKQAIQSEPKIQILPIPANGELSISSPKAPICKLHLYDSFGRLLLSEEGVNVNYHKLLLGSLQAGLYVLSVEKCDGEKSTHKVVLN